MDPLLITLPSTHHVLLYQGSGAGEVDLLAVQAGDQQVDQQGFPGGASKNLPANAGDARDAGSIPGSGRSLENGMATHSSTIAWTIPWTEEPGGPQSTGSQRVGHN